MSKNKFNFLSVGQPYPLFLSNSEGAVFEFIGPSENILLITLRDISKKEKIR